MNNVAFYFLLVSMILNFIVVAYQINKKHSAIVVSCTGLAIVMQAMTMRYVAIS
ncbi:hypothetical protein [Candidatus Nitrospira salsa]|nr:MAG: hypothetical protein NPIRA04_02570 [Nitrospirales bacterium]